MYSGMPGDGMYTTGMPGDGMYSDMYPGDGGYMGSKTDLVETNLEFFFTHIRYSTTTVSFSLKVAGLMTTRTCQDMEEGDVVLSRLSKVHLMSP